jgi:hypothetical protein
VVGLNPTQVGAAAILKILDRARESGRQQERSRDARGLKNSFHHKRAGL